MKKIVVGMLCLLGFAASCVATEEAAIIIASWLPEKSFLVEDIKKWPIEKVYSELELATKFEPYLLNMKSVLLLCKQVNKSKVEFDPSENQESTRAITTELLEAFRGISFENLPSALMHVLLLIIFQRINVYALMTKDKMMQAKKECYKITSEMRRQYAAVSGSANGCSICLESHRDMMTIVGKSCVSFDCLHSFCTECASSLLQNAGDASSIACPLCRELSLVGVIYERQEKALADDRADAARASR